ncbi:MAG: DUF4143 domain-containing protein [Nocardia sp.]|nr:DUF4143 domain-containing protein [Nocardia sp.]
MPGVRARNVGRVDYLGLLEAVFLVHRIEPFTRSATQRTIRSPKVHAVDTGLAAYLTGLTEQKLSSRLPATLSQVGPLVETSHAGAAPPSPAPTPALPWTRDQNRRPGPYP